MSKSFPDRLHSAREMKKLSQADLATKAHMQPSAISHFETGKRLPSFDNLKSLSMALEVSTDYLLGRVEQPNTVSEALFRDVSQLSAEDLETLKKMAQFLAERSPKDGK